MIQLFNQDCMVAMSKMKDKQYQLAIVDPPYGIGDRLVDGGGTNSMIRWQNDYRRTSWDNVPLEEYFAELRRISVNQIICGGNYFPLPPTRCFIVWDKGVMIPSMSRCEYIWTSFDSPARIFPFTSTNKDRIHPTQKPIRLYQWLLKNYAKEGDKILDTHLGSGSSAIAADIMGYDFTGYEIDVEYFAAAKARLERHQKQGKLFG